MKSIGKYQIVEELGGSATGKTYRARDAFRHRELAVKILETVPGLSAETKQQFCEYLASCAELTHRHIAKVHDLGEVDEGIFVATEWLSGMDLRQFMEQNQDLPLDQKLGVIAQVAEGLGFAHSRGIAHGNLKPSNIFVDAARDVSIVDFGVAQWLAALLDAGCRPEALVANYLAPEQVLGQPFDTRSDIFALGLMLYEFASGKYPFSADAGLIPREIVHSEPQPLRIGNPQIPEELEQLVARALKKEAEQRLQTAEEFASGLYLAAQQLRRGTAATAPNAPLSSDSVSSDGIINLLPPALTPSPAIPNPPLATATRAREAVDAQPVQQPALQFPQEAPPVRERPQDAETEPRPWTARSYVASAPPPPTPLAPPPRAATPAYHPPSAHRSAPPAFEPPKSFIKPEAPLPALVQPKPRKINKGLLTAVAGLILAVVIVGSLVSRQSLRAQQSRSRAVTAATEPTEPAVKPAPAPPPVAPEIRAPKREEPAPVDVVNPEVSARQILNGPVRTLWESGRYAQALAYVNQVLASDPTNDEARIWRKKIREAQAAEAALK
jgi:eukaryotic-like serine/threonine-protein kinase